MDNKNSAKIKKFDDHNINLEIMWSTWRLYVKKYNCDKYFVDKLKFAMNYKFECFEYLDLFVDRLVELNIMDDENMFFSIAAIYFGNLELLKKYHNVEINLELTDFEKSLIFDKININIDYRKDTDICSLCIQNNILHDSIISHDSDEFTSNVLMCLQQKTKNHTDKKSNLTISDIKIALFRLLSGVAYRSFRQNFSMRRINKTNIHSGPYTFIDLLDLIDITIQFIKKMHIIDEYHLKYLVNIYSTLNAKYNNMMNNLEDDGYKYGMLETELTRTIEKNNLSCIQVQKNGETKNDIQSKIKILNHRKNSLPYISFVNRFSNIITNKYTSNNRALLPNRLWYETFMPLLLRTFCVDPQTDDKYYNLLDGSENDIILLRNYLDVWFESNYEILSIYCRDVADNFKNMKVNEKLMIKNAWDLTKKFMFNRKSIGINRLNNILVDLSQYVPFIDEYMHKKYVSNREVLVSDREYIDPIWKLLHAIPEIMDKHNIGEHRDMIELFSKFFIAIMKSYPCPYCRNIINNYIFKKKCIQIYPLEYVFLDWNNNSMFQYNIHNTLKNIENVDQLRLFLWKIHNSVNTIASGITDHSPRRISHTIIDDIKSSTSIDGLKSPNCTKTTNSFDSIKDNFINYDRFIGDRNDYYTFGHWPVPYALDNTYRSSYTAALNNLIEIHSKFTKIINLAHEQVDVLDTLGEFIDRTYKSVQSDICIMDNIIIKSKILTRLYECEDYC